jgi:2-polyprenyl-3-methyl-5-hydroxy-6-metoxy-1,4-benzoquinol methylase
MLTIDYDLVGIKDGERILDVGCGEGRHSWEACKRNNCQVCALDIEVANLKKAHSTLYLLDEQGETKGNWILVRGDITSLPFKDASFDKVICSEVLEHIPDDFQGIRELVRVLKDDGTLAVSVPSYLPEAICWKLSRDYHSKPGGHTRIYKASELVSKLQQNNLHIYAIRHKHALHSFYWISRCLFRVNNEKALIPSLYHKFLVWDIKTKSRLVGLLDDLLNKFFSKSIVLYAHKANNLLGNTLSLEGRG